MDKKPFRINCDVVNLGLESFLEKKYQEIPRRNIQEDIFGFEEYAQRLDIKYSQN